LPVKNLVFLLCLVALGFVFQLYTTHNTYTHKETIQEKTEYEFYGTSEDPEPFNRSVFALYEWNIPIKRKLIQEMWKTESNLKSQSLKPDIELFVAIITGYSRDSMHFRKTVRNTWLPHLIDKGIKYKFFLGKPTKTVKDDIQRRSYVDGRPYISKNEKVYGDMVFGPFLDTYRNLTMKTLFATKWAIAHYRFRWFLKVDDDVYLNVTELQSRLSSFNESQHYLGKIEQFSPHRHNDAKPEWIFSWDEVPQDYSPWFKFAHGWTYILSDFATKLLANESWPRLHAEDCNTGMVLISHNISVQHTPNIFNYNNVNEKPSCGETILAIHFPEPLKDVNQVLKCNKEKT